MNTWPAGPGWPLLPGIPSLPENPCIEQGDRIYKLTRKLYIHVIIMNYMPVNVSGLSIKCTKKVKQLVVACGTHLTGSPFAPYGPGGPGMPGGPGIPYNKTIINLPLVCRWKLATCTSEPVIVICNDDTRALTQFGYSPSFGNGSCKSKIPLLQICRIVRTA